MVFVIYKSLELFKPPQYYFYIYIICITILICISQCSINKKTLSSTNIINIIMSWTNSTIYIFLFQFLFSVYYLHMFSWIIWIVSIIGTTPTFIVCHFLFYICYIYLITLLFLYSNFIYAMSDPSSASSSDPTSVSYSDPSSVLLSDLSSL